MSKQIAIMKLLPSLEIAGCINELLRLLIDGKCPNE
nr:MAG TPA: hypothetical protein [Caudoviricetes sp.]